MEIKSIFRDERAFAQGSAVGILILLATLMLCALLYGTLQGQTDAKIAALESDEANASYANIVSSGWGAIDLFSMVPYVGVFVVIIGALMGLGGGRR
jgi:hypothetical protein